MCITQHSSWAASHQDLQVESAPKDKPDSEAAAAAAREQQARAQQDSQRKKAKAAERKQKANQKRKAQEAERKAQDTAAKAEVGSHSLHQHCTVQGCLTTTPSILAWKHWAT